MTNNIRWDGHRVYNGCPDSTMQKRLDEEAAELRKAMSKMRELGGGEPEGPHLPLFCCTEHRISYDQHITRQRIANERATTKKGDDMIKVYHVNRDNVRFKKDAAGEKYPGLKKYWGSIIVFEKAERTQRKFANLMDVDGYVCHTITRATYRLLTSDPSTRHIYERGLDAAEACTIKDLVAKMTDLDIKEVRELLAIRHAEISDYGCECECERT